VILRLVPLAAAAFFMITGSYAMNIEENGLPGVALLVAGLIILGVWISIESWSAIEGKRLSLHTESEQSPEKKENE
jgi:hypothetical protein